MVLMVTKTAKGREGSIRDKGGNFRNSFGARPAGALDSTPQRRSHLVSQVQPVF